MHALRQQNVYRAKKSERCQGPFFSVKTLEKRLAETAENGYGLSDLP
jgi:hypothetical protein